MVPVNEWVKGRTPNQFSKGMSLSRKKCMTLTVRPLYDAHVEPRQLLSPHHRHVQLQDGHRLLLRRGHRWRLVGTSKRLEGGANFFVPHFIQCLSCTCH